LKTETLRAFCKKDMACLERSLESARFSTGDGDLTIALKPSQPWRRCGEARRISGATNVLPQPEHRPPTKVRRSAGANQCAKSGIKLAAQQAPV